jgi:hypothetical protein
MRVWILTRNNTVLGVLENPIAIISPIGSILRAPADSVDDS